MAGIQVRDTIGVVGFLFLFTHWAWPNAGQELPTNNPASQYGLGWTEELNWSNCVSIQDFKGESVAASLEAAQRAVGENGGTVFFPAGVYHFAESVFIKNGVVIRGADPSDVTDARSDTYDPPTRFEFPKYVPRTNGSGTLVGTAFKGIYLEDPASASNCGIVNVAINRGHIAFKEGPGHKAGRNRIVYGCVLRNAAVADPAVPDTTAGQHAWQRFTSRHHPAVGVWCSENILVANNRLPASGEDSFLMKPYILRGRSGKNVVVEGGVWFDYDNRPGLYVNNHAIGAPGGNPPDGTPQTHPWGFRKGIVIRDNYIFCTGRCAISFTGDGTVCAGNVIRFEPDVVRPTVTGLTISTGSSTNDNRAVQMRGWRWMVDGNDYLVYRNWAADKKYYINDGEGLMHEDHVNSTVLDSKVINNKGNAYISIYKTGGINGLLVQGNDIRTSGGIAAIYIVADRNSGRHECRNVRIIENTTAGSGITIAGHPAENNVVTKNRHIGAGEKLINLAAAQVEDNSGYDLAD